MFRKARFAYILLSTLGWTVIHWLMNDKLALLLVPACVREYVKSQKAKDKEFRYLSKANGTALIHSILVSPSCLFLGARLMADDPWEGQSNTFECIAIVMLGYFCWDICICLTNISSYGLAFLLHGVLSLIGLYVQVASNRCRMLGFAAIFAASELSTPFLHCRWYCIKAKHTRTKYFQFVNLIFLGIFIAFRVIYLPVFVFPIFWKDCLVLDYVHNMSYGRRILQIVITVVWSLLNYYWGVLLLTAQLRQWRRPSSAGKQRDTKSSESNGEAVSTDDNDSSDNFAEPIAFARKFSS